MTREEGAGLGCGALQYNGGRSDARRRARAAQDREKRARGLLRRLKCYTASAVCVHRIIRFRPFVVIHQRSDHDP